MSAVRDLAELVRAPAALSVPGDTLVGAAAAGTLGLRTAGLATASVCLYWAGMAANDWADREVDAEQRPQRPIPSGRVTPETAFRLAAGLTATGCALAAVAGGRRALLAASALACSIWAYDTGFAGCVPKESPLGPVTMAACRGLDVLLGASGGDSRRALAPALTIAAHTFTVSALSRREVQGSDPLLPAATFAGTAAVAAVALRANDAGDTGNGPRTPSGRLLAVPIAGWYAAQYGAAQLRAVSDPAAANLRRAVGAGITALPALQGALAARLGARTGALALAAVAPLGRRLAARLEVT